MVMAIGVVVAVRLEVLIRQQALAVAAPKLARAGGEGEEGRRGTLPRSSRRGSRPQLHLRGAAIQGNCDDRNPTILLPSQSDDISHLALDIGGWVVCGYCVLLTL